MLNAIILFMLQAFDPLLIFRCVTHFNVLNFADQ